MQTGNAMAIAVEVSGECSPLKIIGGAVGIRGDGGGGIGGIGEVQVAVQADIRVPEHRIAAVRIELFAGADDIGIGAGAAAGEGQFGIPGQDGVVIVGSELGHFPDIVGAVVGFTDEVPAGVGEGGLLLHLGGGDADAHADFAAVGPGSIGVGDGSAAGLGIPETMAQGSGKSRGVGIDAAETGGGQNVRIHRKCPGGIGPQDLAIPAPAAEAADISRTAGYCAGGEAVLQRSLVHAAETAYFLTGAGDIAGGITTRYGQFERSASGGKAAEPSDIRPSGYRCIGRTIIDAGIIAAAQPACLCVSFDGAAGGAVHDPAHAVQIMFSNQAADTFIAADGDIGRAVEDIIPGTNIAAEAADIS